MLSSKIHAHLHANDIHFARNISPEYKNNEFTPQVYYRHQRQCFIVRETFRDFSSSQINVKINLCHYQSSMYHFNDKTNTAKGLPITRQIYKSFSEILRINNEDIILCSGRRFIISKQISKNFCEDGTVLQPIH